MAVMEQEILEKIRTLPIEKQVEVMKFIETLSGEASKPKRKSIVEEIAEIVKDVPDEVWEKIPKDGSINHDHYLYGTPKRYRCEE